MLHGLTASEVREKQKQGKINTSPRSKNNTVSRIIMRNLFTIFNLVNLILGVAIISVGAYKNALFLGVAILNCLIGIVNEVRAKTIIDRLRLISEKKQTVIRDGEKTPVNSEAIVEGDLICFNLGSQITVDALIIEGSVEVNESFITGESDNITKQSGDRLLSGSFVVSGHCVAEAVSVGKDSLINQINTEATALKPTQSQLFQTMNKIIKFISVALIPIGIMLLLSRFFFVKATPEIAVTSTVAALISMIPQGLVLLISSVLALSSIRLSKKNVLVQDMYAIETLARIDAICLDKTGTITTGNMKVTRMIPTSGHSESEMISVISAILEALPPENATGKALLDYCGHESADFPEPIISTIPFSSERKHSGIRSAQREFLMGALEFMTDNPDFLEQEQALNSESRTIAVMKKTFSDEIISKEELIGFVQIEDELRNNAKTILDYLCENQIKPIIISGDHINTVTKIAEQVGLQDLRAVDLSKTASPDFTALINEYNIFTRVLPEQKKMIVSALKNAGHTVAMTGDGVNDVLAMKASDCSISIGDGADAAKRISKIVLLDSDFSAIPDIVNEGRQTINNIECSATLFLSKTTYAVILSVLYVLLPLVYPFVPIGMTFLNFICIGFPAFVLALQPNRQPIKNEFLYNIFCYSLPTGIVISLNVIAISVCQHLLNLSYSETITLAMITTILLSIFLLYRISRPFNLYKKLLFILIVLLCVGAFLIPIAREFFVLSVPELTDWIIFGILTVIGLPLTIILEKLGKKAYDKKFKYK